MKKACAIVLITLISCASFAQSDAAFFKELESRKGKTYYGKAIYMPDTVTANDYWGEKLSFKIKSASKSELRIPFQVGENKTRTWVLKKTSSGLQLKHDHRHADGSADSITNYGGNSSRGISTELIQYFPADEFTAKLLPAAATNRWIMQFSADKKKFYYILERDNKMRFKAEFILK